MKAINLFRTIVFGLTVVGLAPGGMAHAEAGKGGEEQAAEKKEDTYPLDVCPISGARLGSMGEPIVRFYDGREVRFCCAGCPDAFEEDLEANLKKLDRLIIDRQKSGYPLDVWVVSGEKLGEMGEPVDHVHDNRLVRFCCAGCVDTFKEDPDKYLKKLHAAYEAREKGKATPAPEGSVHEGHGNHQDQGEHEDHSGHEAH